MTYDVITIGSATRDVFVRSKAMEVRQEKESQTGALVCLPLGSKVEVNEIHFATGGSAINAAVTFARQGLRAATVAKVGDDPDGNIVWDEMKSYGIVTLTELVNGQQTAYSVLLSTYTGERTILVARGISEHLTEKDFSWNDLKQTKWWYVTHLGGESAKLFAPLLNFAHENNISVALNPGKAQLAMGAELVPLLKYVKVFILNKEEAAYLTGVPYTDEDGIFAKLDEWVDGIAVMTKGSDGLKVSDGKYRWSAGILKEPLLADRTGAGDAFGSGFTSALIKGMSVEDAIQLGSANATGVIGEWGANNGLLAPDDSMDKFGKLSLDKKEIV